MKTSIPYIETECINNKYPTIKGTCFPGVINVYNTMFQLVKTITINDTKFFINLEDTLSDAYVITNTAPTQEESDYSRIVVKCCDSIDNYECRKCSKCQTISSC